LLAWKRVLFNSEEVLFVWEEVLLNSKGILIDRKRVAANQTPLRLNWKGVWLNRTHLPPSRIPFLSGQTSLRTSGDLSLPIFEHIFNGLRKSSSNWQNDFAIS
jgi:hypothetical protein